MTGDGHSSEDTHTTAVPTEEPYGGAAGQTHMETVHWTREDGSVVSVRVHTSVNATNDPAVAERLVTGNLNWVQLGGSDELQPVPVPVVYHDEVARLFLLVLPEAFRSREIAERAALLRRLSEDTAHDVPAYVLSFRVVYVDALGLVLEDADGEPAPASVGESELEEREEAIVAREAKLAEWEENLRADRAELELDLKQREILDQAVPDDAAAELQKRYTELDRREGELREVERHLMERQLEVERQEKILQHRARKLERREAGGAHGSETGTDSPTKVADRESMEIAARESAGFAGTDTSGLILDGPPEEELAARVAAGGDAAYEDLDEMSESEIEAELEAAGTPPARAKGGRRRDTDATSLAQAVLAVTEEDEEGEPQDEPDAVAAEADEVDAEVADDVPEEEPGMELPPELDHWVDEEPAPARYFRDGVLHLAAVLPAERAEFFVGLDPAAVFQLHELPTYPLLVLGLVAEEGEEMAELDPPAAFWPLDIRSEEDMDLMDRLAEDFRFVLEIYDEDLYLVASTEVHFPLEENVRVVRERAALWLEELELEPDPEAARQAFLDPEYRWLPVGELPFGPMGFEELASAAAVVEALPAIEEWSQSDREDELILLRSFPAGRWRRMCLEVLEKAIEYGIWMAKELRQRALDAGYATSRKDLLRGCLTGFERVCLGELPSELTPADEHDNWQALLSAAERLGIVVDPSWEDLAAKAAKRQEFVESDEALETEALEESDGELGEDQDADVEPIDADELEEVDEEDVQEVEAGDLILESDDEGTSGEPLVPSAQSGLSEEDLDDLAPMELIALLGDPEARLNAALELCRRKEVKAAAELFATLEQMRKPEIIRLFPHLVGLGPEVQTHLVTSLRSGSSIIRQGSALALGALGDEQTAEELVELLLDEPTEIWMEVAQALGDLGSGALMTVAAHVRHATGEQWERLSQAMACIAFESGQRDGIVELSGSRNEDAASVAQRALDLLSERRLEEDGAEDDLPPRDKPALFFSRRFFDARARDEAELGEEDILDEEDIVENGDVMAEEPLTDGA